MTPGLETDERTAIMRKMIRLKAAHDKVKQHKKGSAEHKAALEKYSELSKEIRNDKSIVKHNVAEIPFKLG